MLFLSYDALTPRYSVITEKMGRAHMKRVLSEQTYRTRLWPLMFFIMFFTFAADLRLPVRHTCIVTLCATLLLAGLSAESPMGSDFNIQLTRGQIIIFMIVCILGIVFA